MVKEAFILFIIMHTFSKVSIITKFYNQKNNFEKESSLKSLLKLFCATILIKQ